MRDFSKERLLHLFTTAPGAFWRHDVDVSLAAAVRMAELAQLAGVSSTFYLNPRSGVYNLFSSEGQRAVETILDRGHRVGVHVDANGYHAEEAVVKDCHLVDAGYPGLFKDRLVSFHMPKPDVLWQDFHWFENAYASKWEGRYLADSRARPIDLAQVDDSKQINLHPEHWVT